MTKPKVTLAIVTSVNGKITKGGLPPKNWASKEDQQTFYQLQKSHQVILIGSKTFNIYQRLIKPLPEKLKIIMTSTPKKYSSYQIPGQLEFWGESPLNLIAKIGNMGYKSILLTTGPKINTQFLDLKLVDELWITIEPEIFRSGLDMTNGLNKNIILKLRSHTKLNKEGTILLKYQLV